MSRLDISLDLASLSSGYARGTITPGGVIDEIYSRIAQSDPAIWITLRPQGEARAAASNASRGPLYGVPFAVKDNIDCAGMPTTCACPAFAYTPERSARVVELLEAAGAILIGKTNLDQFATGLNGTRSPYGVPKNPIDERYIPGGSSSGSAVAVARGLVSFALGTDTAGSGRVPAAFNNIVGLKPTKGTISARGLVPACRTLDTVSIFAPTVPDAAAIYDVVNVFDPEDDYSRRERPGPAVHGQRLRIGIPKEELEFFGDAEAARLYEATAARARDLGHDIVGIDYAPFAAAAKLLYQGPWVAERLAAIRDFATSKSEAMDATVRQIILDAQTLDAASAFQGFYELARLVRVAEVQWSKMDALMLPSAPTIYTVDQMRADPIRLNSNLGLYTNFVNLMDLSAIAIPAGFRDDGLPFGVTLIARAFEDPSLAQLGDDLHRALPAARLGATEFEVASTARYVSSDSGPRRIAVAVVGAHLTGQPLNSQLTERGARLVRTAKTAAGYSFYALANTTPAKPGLVYDGHGAGNIEVEIWDMDEGAFGSFVASIPAPLGIGTLTLDDGQTVKGFLCESHAVVEARDITSNGGWRNWLNSR